MRTDERPSVFDTVKASPRVLILTAPVGGGHDAAARAVARELEAQGYEPIIANALRRSGRWVEWLIVRGYQFQLRRAPWTYELLYRLLKRRWPSRLGKWLPGFVGARSIRKLLDETQPSLVVTTYHLASAMLVRLRRQGKLPIPAAAMITDLAPHPMWCHPRMDAHLAMDERSARGFGAIAKAPTLAVRPPVDPAFGSASRADGRNELALGEHERAVAVVGGAWGNGHLIDTVRSCANAGWRPVVVTGRNVQLRKQLEAEAPETTIVLGYVDNMPSVLAASDAVVVNAPGLTCLEGFASRIPVLVHDPIPGHGVHNAKYMEECGLVTYTRSAPELTQALEGLARDPRPLQITRAARLFQGPGCADVLTRLHAAPAPRRRRAAVAVLVACLIAALTTTQVGVAETSELLRRHVVEPGGRAHDIALCIRFGRDLSNEEAALDLLRGSDAHATFFVSAKDALDHPAEVRDLAASGNEVGNGGARGRKIVVPVARRNDRRASDQIHFATGSFPRYSMPAAGRVTLGQVLAASRERPVLGAVRVERLRKLRPGEIVVVDLSRPDGLSLISALIVRAASSNLRLVDLSELLAARG